MINSIHSLQTWIQLLFESKKPGAKVACVHLWHKCIVHRSSKNLFENNACGLSCSKLEIFMTQGTNVCIFVILMHQHLKNKKQESQIKFRYKTNLFLSELSVFLDKSFQIHHQALLSREHALYLLKHRHDVWLTYL